MIFISAGHYPSAPGAKWERFVEHDEATVWADLLVAQIDDSMRVPTGILRDKVNFINERVMNGDIAVEIHFNAARDKNNNPVGRGCETLYYPGSDRGEKLAEICQVALKSFYPPDRGAKEGWYRMDVSKGPDFFLAKTTCTAVIVEPEFVHRSQTIQDNSYLAINSLAKALVAFDTYANPVETTQV
jgi:N-acetylmuramoyl-L-alanine amidase